MSKKSGKSKKGLGAVNTLAAALLTDISLDGLNDIGGVERAARWCEDGGWAKCVRCESEYEVVSVGEEGYCLDCASKLLREHVGRVSGRSEAGNEAALADALDLVLAMAPQGAIDRKDADEGELEDEYGRQQAALGLVERHRAQVLSALREVHGLRQSLADCLRQQKRPGDYWGEDKDYPVRDWRMEVQNDDTRQGYWEWVEAQREADAMDEDDA